MRRFLQRLSVFLLLGAVYMAACYALNTRLADDGLPAEFASDVETLLAGDSQIRRALDPDFIPRSANTASSGEPYFVVYWKLQRILPEVPSVKRVVIGFGPHSVSEFHFSKVRESPYSQNLFSRIYPIERCFELVGVDVDWQALWTQRVKHMCLFPHTRHGDYLPGYANNDRKSTEKAVQASRRHFYDADGSVLDTSEMLVGYLEKILDYCAKRDVEVVLVKVPVHESYREHIPEKFVDAFASLESEMRDRGVRIVDLSADVEVDADHFRDANHLNQSGAERVSRALARALEL